MEIFYAAKLRLLQQIAIQAESDSHQRNKTNPPRDVQEHTGRIFDSKGNFGSVMHNVIKQSTSMVTTEEGGQYDVTYSCPTQLKSVPSL